MSFSINCKFQDIYLLAYLLKDFGLQNLYPSRKKELEIAVGTYLYQVSSMGKYALAETISIDSFLGIDPKSNTQFVVDTYFENKFSDHKEDCEQYYDNRDSDEDQTEWSHYNDNLDMDQQSLEFWNQFYLSLLRNQRYFYLRQSAQMERN